MPLLFVVGKILMSRIFNGIYLVRFINLIMAKCVMPFIRNSIKWTMFRYNEKSSGFEGFNPQILRKNEYKICNFFISGFSR